MSVITNNEGRVGFGKGGIYIVRDVFQDGKFSGCEYAVLKEDGLFLEWRPCQEGTEYSAISPMVTMTRAIELGVNE